MCFGQQVFDSCIDEGACSNPIRLGIAVADPETAYAQQIVIQQCMAMRRTLKTDIGDARTQVDTIVAPPWPSLSTSWNADILIIRKWHCFDFSTDVTHAASIQHSSSQGNYPTCLCCCYPCIKEWQKVQQLPERKLVVQNRSAY